MIWNMRLPALSLNEEKPSPKPPGPANKSITGILSTFSPSPFLSQATRNGVKPPWFTAKTIFYLNRKFGMLKESDGHLRLLGFQRYGCRRNLGLKADNGMRHSVGSMCCAHICGGSKKDCSSGKEPEGRRFKSCPRYHTFYCFLWCSLQGNKLL